MKIFGQEYGFLLTVGASAEIADLCPDGDLSKIGDMLNGKFSDIINFTASFVAEMAKGYDEAERYSGRPVDHAPLTPEMVKALPSSAMKEVQDAALAAFRADMKTTVEVAPSKKKENPGIN